MDNQAMVRNPAQFVPGAAVAFGAVGDAATAVDPFNPLPVGPILTPATSTPLAGTMTQSAMAGPFVPQLGRPISLTLGGSWSGTVQLLRSTDGGATRLPLTYPDGSAKGVWSGALNAAVAEESVAGATYYLAVTLTSGTLAYQLEQ